MAEVHTIQQYPDPRVPTNPEQMKRFVGWLKEVLDDIYRRFGRLRFEDLGKGVRQWVEDTDGSIAAIDLKTDAITLSVQDVGGQLSVILQTAQAITSRVDDMAGNVTTLMQTADGLILAINNNRVVFDANGMTLVNNSGKTVFRQDMAGNLDITGIITALGGVLGGFAITGDGLTNGNAIQLLSSGEIRVGGIKLEGGSHPAMSFSDGGRWAFHVGEGTFTIENVLVVGGPGTTGASVYLKNLPVTGEPPNLYVDADGRVYRTIYGESG